MKKIFFLAGLALIWASCTNHNKTTVTQVADSTKTSISNMKINSKPDDKNLKVVNPIFANMDAVAASGITKLTGDYMGLKNALVADDASGAADAAGVLSNDLKNTDKSKFTAEQKTAYEKNEDDLKENAEHISKSKNDIHHQREHFGMLSEDMVDLVKSFGSTQPLYNNHCPMADDKKGSNWLSETDQIKNPYMGKKDMTCGNVVEVIKK
jgi:PBP1b-binding outer membrane lipoprotein LpoB